MRTLMPDTPSLYPSPPPSPLPDYQPPAVAQPPVGYPQNWQAQPQPTVGAGWGAAGLLYQFSGPAAWACGIGLLTIVVPFFLNRVFFFLPIVGVIYGIRAIQRGKLIGGITGIVLSAIGGILTLFGLFG